MSFTIFQNEKTPFQAIKTRSSKSRKIDIFLKGLTHGIEPKMAIFPTFFFQVIQARAVSFTIFQKEKSPFQAIKTRSSNSKKKHIFPKGLTHGIGPKMAIFPPFILRRYRPENDFYDILERKNAFLGNKNKKFKSQKTDIFQKGLTHEFWSNNGNFSTFFFLGNIGQKMSFTIFQNEKTPFQAIKTRSSNSQKIDIFPEGLTHGFGPIITLLTNFFFLAVQARKITFTIFQNEKSPFQAIKTRSLKKQKIDIFPKGLTHGFGPIISILRTFFF